MFVENFGLRSMITTTIVTLEALWGIITTSKIKKCTHQKKSPSISPITSIRTPTLLDFVKESS